MTDKVKKVLYLLLSSLIVSLLYILLHEFGHLVVMVSAGATITDFSILTAHVSATGGHYSNLAALWLPANGAALPVIAAFVYMLFYKTETKNTFYITFSYIVSLTPIMSLFAWVILPFIFMLGKAPVGDDVTSFLIIFTLNYHPLIVSVGAVLIIAVGIIVMIKKGIIKNFIFMIRER